MNENEKKSKNKVLNALGLLLIFGVLIALLIIVSKNQEVKSTTKIQEISYAGLKEQIKSENYTIVLLASPTCSHCVAYKPLMNSVAAKYDLDIYYLNVNSSDLTLEDYTNIHDSVTALKDQYDEDGYPVIPTPTTVIYKNNTEVASKSGNIKDTGFLTFLKDNGVVR